MQKTGETMTGNPPIRLNPAQTEAVTAAPGNLLVLAGAGSGKTRVLVQRIVWLIENRHYSPHEILAVTFTNKAAAEMRQRIEDALGISLRGIWVGTFHSIAHRLLRIHWQEAGLPENFQIIDSDDQLRLIKRLMREQAIDEKRWPPRQLQWFINQCKDEGRRSTSIQPGHDPFNKVMLPLYTAYEKACNQLEVVDFNELLLRAHELWLRHPQVLKHYQARFRAILVDEFQDTNTVQYAWLRVLAGSDEKVMAVGDDDQSIYGWRGARIEHIQQFKQHFPNARTITLEQNYRSSGTILQAANALINHNSSRLGKNLWTDGESGEPVKVYQALNEEEEARYIVGRIRQWVDSGGACRDVAVLYRSNAQSRVLEEALIREGLPYRIYGGHRFFDRAEIRHAMAYLKLMVNPEDDTAFERVVNFPPRGIGEKTQDQIRQFARQQPCSLWSAAAQLVAKEGMSSRGRQSISRFIQLIVSLKETPETSLDRLVDRAIQHSGLMAHYSRERGEQAQARIENLQELVSAAREFDPATALLVDDGLESIRDAVPVAVFLDHAALESGDSQAESFQDCVQLMTLHAVKGLEFPLVFISGMDEGLFPHKMSLDAPGGLEEERRLCYVGITRAMQQLWMTCAETRRIHGMDNASRPSRFIREVPDTFKDEVRIGGTRVGVPATNRRRRRPPKVEKTVPDTPYQLGQTVSHPTFGEGVITNYSGQGSQVRVEVNFARQGSKWLVLAYAKLQAV
jgi:DNA helicase-2/ATP-dependent DNA helicase PcrA